MKSFLICTSCLILLVVSDFSFSQDQNVTEKKDVHKMWCQYEGQHGPGKGKHVVLIAGDDEYRSEEALPMLGKILAVRHGFNCTVLFPINAEGFIQPDYQEKIPGMHFLKSADVVILGLRFRNLPDKDMALFAEYVESGKPIIALRTTTHAFRIPADREYARYSFDSKTEGWQGGFGQRVLGDTWVNHHGKHGKQSTRGIVNNKQGSHPVLTGIRDVWGPTDVYTIRNLPDSAKVLLHGQVLAGMQSNSKPLEGRKNDPMMPLAWVNEYKTESDKSTRIFCTTMGAATDFQSVGLRRLVVNATYWSAALERNLRQELAVDFVDRYQPTQFGFGGYRKNVRPADYDLKTAAR